MSNIDMSGYNDVASRMREFFEKHPDGRLRPADGRYSDEPPAEGR